MIKLQNVTKKYNELIVLDNINLEVKRGEFLTITGQSGSGKTTLLNIMGMITPADNGNVVLMDQINPSGKVLATLRKNKIAYVFQNYFLLEEETVAYNLKLPLTSKRYVESDAVRLLESVMLDASILKKKVYQLSGGEQQRVAFARALLKDFDILLADEPTGNLDIVSRDILLDILGRIKNLGKTIVCVTHDSKVTSTSDRVISLIT